MAPCWISSFRISLETATSFGNYESMRLSGLRRGVSEAMAQVVFCSTIGRAYQHDLEHLLFFNARQTSVRAAVVEALERYGAPSIKHEEDALRVIVSGYPGEQCLFALAETEDPPDLLGAVIYVRSPADTLTILHLAVSDDTLTEDDQNPLLVVRLVHRVRQLARSIRGVKWVHVLYSRGGGVRIPIQPTGRHA